PLLVFQACVPFQKVISYRKRKEKGREDAPPRRIEYDRALWPKYAFFAGPSEAVYAAKATGLMQALVPNVHQARLVDQLESLTDQLQTPQSDASKELQDGKWYRLLWPHAFAGYIGSATIRDGRVFLELDLFGDKRPVEIEKKHWELLGRI